jgi:hypothetical protein
MPASDVSAWAKAATKPAYKWSEITDKPTSFTPATHTHTKSEITDFPTIPDAPGTLQTNLTAALTTSASESLSGAIKLHKISKTGRFSDLTSTSHTHQTTDITLSTKNDTVNTAQITFDYTNNNYSVYDIIHLIQEISTCTYTFIEILKDTSQGKTQTIILDLTQGQLQTQTATIIIEKGNGYYYLLEGRTLTLNKGIHVITARRTWSGTTINIETYQSI